MNQIKEIQSLRGIAVLFVLFYHLKILGFSGGFVGVDIFFVISGFIITRQIFTSIEKEKFKFSDFFFKRIKRLFPALLSVVIISFIFSYFLYSPNDLVEFSKEALSSTFGVQNFYLLSKSVYFDISAFNKTLLHVWSLSVEEQFYIFWPLLLLLLIRFFNKKKISIILILVIILSILMNVFFSKYENYIFYMLPFRGFEFLVGALAFFLYDSINNKMPFVRKGLFSYSLLSILIVLIIIVEESSLTFILGIVTLSFLLLFSKDNLILSNNALCFVGNISYSLYLVHWPLLVFYLYINLKLISELNFFEQVFLIVISFVFSYLTYIFIESKFRYTSFRSTRWRALFVILIVFVLTLIISIKESGLLTRYNSKVSKSLEYLALDHENYTSKNFRLFKEYTKYSFKTFHDEPVKLKGNFESDEKIKLLVIGDSQAADFVNVLVESNRNDYELRTIPISAGCQSIILPLDNYQEFAKKYTELKKVDIPYCEREHTYLWRSEVVKEADVIVIAAHYRLWAVNYFKDTIGFFKEKNPSGKVYFLKLKNQKYYPKNLIHLKSKNFNTLGKHAIDVNNSIENSIGKDSLISINNILCNKGDCSLFTNTNFPIFFDKIHFTPEGSKYIAKKREFDDFLDKLLKKDSNVK